MKILKEIIAANKYLFFETGFRFSWHLPLRPTLVRLEQWGHGLDWVEPYVFGDVKK